MILQIIKHVLIFSVFTIYSSFYIEFGFDIYDKLFDEDLLANELI